MPYCRALSITIPRVPQGGIKPAENERQGVSHSAAMSSVVAAEICKVISIRDESCHAYLKGRVVLHREPVVTALSDDKSVIEGAACGRDIVEGIV